MKRKVFSREFNLKAVKLVKERGMTCAQVARDLEVGQNVVSRWVRETQIDKTDAFHGRGQLKPNDAEIARLKRELAQTRADPDILAKPSATSRRCRREVRSHCAPSGDLAAALDVSGNGGDAGRILCLGFAS